MNEASDSNAPTVEIVPAGESSEFKTGVLAVKIPNIEALSAASEFHGGTKIGISLGQAIVPVSYGLFNVPTRILEVVQTQIENAETISPITVITAKRQLLRFQEATADLVVALMGGDDLNRMYMYQAVKDAKAMSLKYCEAMMLFCTDMSIVKEQYASEQSFFLAQALNENSQVAVDMELIDGPLEELVNRLNKISSGEGSYKIVSLLTAIDDIGNMLANATIQALFGASNSRAMFNQLGFRIKQNDVMFYRQMKTMVDQIQPRMQSNGKAPMPGKEVLALITVAEHVQKGLERMQQMLTNKDEANS